MRTAAPKSGSYLFHSEAVILLWHDVHRLIRLSLSWVPPLDKGNMWCTSVARVIRPASSHMWQSGCSLICLSRIFFHAVPYLFLAAGSLWNLLYLISSAFWCSSQNRPSVRFGQPGCEQGLFVFLGTSLLLCKEKGHARFVGTSYTFSTVYTISHFSIYKSELKWTNMN